MHETEPGLLAMLPSGQASHPSVLEFANLPIGQMIHPEDPVPLVAVPGAQRAHSTLPVLSAKLPIGQRTQEEAPVSF